MMHSRLDDVERAILEQTSDSDEVIAVVEAILLARKLRAQSAGYTPTAPRLCADPQPTRKGVIELRTRGTRNDMS